MAIQRPTYWPAAGRQEGRRAGYTVGQGWGCGEPRCGKQVGGWCRQAGVGAVCQAACAHPRKAVARAMHQCSHSLELGTHSLNMNISRVPWWNHIFMGGSALLLPAFWRSRDAGLDVSGSWLQPASRAAARCCTAGLGCRAFEQWLHYRGRPAASDASSATLQPTQPSCLLHSIRQCAPSAASPVQNMGKAPAASWLAQNWRQWSHVSMSGMAAEPRSQGCRR